MTDSTPTTAATVEHVRATYDGDHDRPQCPTCSVEPVAELLLFADELAQRQYDRGWYAGQEEAAHAER